MDKAKSSERGSTWIRSSAGFYRRTSEEHSQYTTEVSTYLNQRCVPFGRQLRTDPSTRRKATWRTMQTRMRARNKSRYARVPVMVQRQVSTSVEQSKSTMPLLYIRATPSWRGKVGVHRNDEVRQPTHVREASTDLASIKGGRCDLTPYAGGFDDSLLTVMSNSSRAGQNRTTSGSIGKYLLSADAAHATPKLRVAAKIVG